MGEAKLKAARYAAALAAAKAQKKRKPAAPETAPTSAERAALVLARTRARNAALPAPDNGVMTRQRRRRTLILERKAWARHYGVSRR